MKIAMTGANGHMGVEALAQALELDCVEFVRVLLSTKKKNNKLAKRWKKKYQNRIQILRGNIQNAKVCKSLVSGVDVVVHMAAVIPPASDASFQASEDCNLRGAVALVDAVKSCSPQPKYIHISTVALYGSRNEKHPFGRVGDPLLVSPFDVYAMHKLQGERYCLDAELDCWTVLRQTAMLHPDMMKCNISDGLMFHTVMNAPLEWATARDSGLLIKRILERDNKGEIDFFWNRIYNIGAGFRGRETGYDTFNDGFAIIGGSTEKFFRPNWFPTRNFHGLWFSDSDVLENLFHYQRDGVREYWQEIKRAHKIYALGKFVPKKLIHLFLFRKLLHHPNSAYRWVEIGDVPRVTASFGSMEQAKNLSRDWKDYKLLAKGDFGDYDALRDAELAKKNGTLVSLGYDEEKPESEWTTEDLRSAATFRGGEVLFEGNDIHPYRKITWRCHEGHTFEASPYTVLKGGHWCPECTHPSPWNYDRLAKHSPFHAQVWYDSHEPSEANEYRLENGKAVLKAEKEKK